MLEPLVIVLLVFLVFPLELGLCLAFAAGCRVGTCCVPRHGGRVVGQSVLLQF